MVILSHDMQIATLYLNDVMTSFCNILPSSFTKYFIISLYKTQAIYSAVQ